MKVPKVLFVSLLALFAISLISFPAALVSGQVKGDAGQAQDFMKAGPAAREHDNKAMKKLKGMTPEEVEALDEKLAEALNYLYDGKYARALPLFKEVSLKVETMDMMFWSATCAYKAGDPDLAIKKFMKMLEIDPDLHQARIELAIAYYSLGDYDNARKQLQTVLTGEPHESLRMRVEKLIAAIDRKDRRLFYNLRLSQAIEWDSNVSAGSNSKYVNLPTGGLLTLRRTEREVSDWVGVTNFYGSVTYDPFFQKRLMWNITGQYYQSRNLNHYAFDYIHAYMNTGPWWTGKKYVIKVPVGYGRNVYGHHDLYDTFDVNPSFEYFFNGNMSLKAGFSYDHDSYARSRDYVLNNKTYVYEINPNFYFNNKNDIISLHLSYENRDAKDHIYSYDGFNAAVSYFRRFSWDMELYAYYQYSDRGYREPERKWLHDRKDDRHYVYLAVSQNFLKYFFASLYFKFIHNDSNTALYDYDKTVFGLNTGFQFY
ncbi:MAG: tetratricopeptide repeat protein [Deltaproteobacteria bacterium]|nr:tetratricopeptide repeat protein [Deltaproteobacteria bacterium]